MTNNKKRGLGHGLDVLIPPTEEEEKEIIEKSAGGITELTISEVEPNRDQPRKKFDEDALQELSESIKKHGIIQPLLVQKKDDYYEIIAGERRWRAAKNAGLEKVPVIIMELPDQEKYEVSLIENIQRENLNPIEEAEAYQQLIETYHLKQDEIAEKVSKSRTAITNSLRLLKLDKRVRQMVIDDMISTGHARALLGISDLDEQYKFAQRVFDEKMSVRDVEKEIRKLSQKPVKKEELSKPVSEQLKTIYNELEEKLKQRLGTKVKISAKDSEHGKLEIEYFSAEELEKIINILNRD